MKGNSLRKLWFSRLLLRSRRSRGGCEEEVVGAVGGHEEGEGLYSRLEESRNGVWVHRRVVEHAERYDAYEQEYGQ